MPAPVKNCQLIIAEDHDLVRESLAFMLEERGFSNIRQAADGQQCLDTVNHHICEPTVVLMDIGMPVMNGIAASQAIKTAHPATKIIMLTSHQNEDDVLASLAAGADGYCMKDISIDRLCTVIAEIMEGGLWLDPTVAAVVQQHLQVKQPTEVAEKPSKPTRYNPNLTSRELSILEKVVEGLSNREIGDALSISPHTVKTHVTNIIQKLAATDRTQAAVKAVQFGLITN